MRQLRPEKPPADLAEVEQPNFIKRWGQDLCSIIYKSYVMIEMEIRKLRHDYTELLTRVIQPILWLSIFGQAMNKVRAIPTGTYSYLQFMTPGILAQSVIFTAIFYGISVIWERDLGLVQKFLITPTPRLALIIGKMAAAGIRGISQAWIVMLVAFLMGIQLQITFLGVIGIILAVMLGAGIFAGLSMIIASIVKTRERFMGIGQLITMPLFFASNAIYPIKIMPGWLQVIAHINPLSYMVDILRGLILKGYRAQIGVDFVVLIISLTIIATISANSYHRVVV